LSRAKKKSARTTTGEGVTAPRVVVAGGHSAGHIEPTMNFADALRRLEPTAEIIALGTVRGGPDDDPRTHRGRRTT
jgi:hypothetical protein